MGFYRLGGKIYGMRFKIFKLRIMAEFQKGYGIRIWFNGSFPVLNIKFKK